MRLTPDFWARPFAHRGLHDVAAGVPENGLAAFAAAIDNGYAIELDVQASADGEAMVFHDYELERLAEGSGRIDAHDAASLRQMPLIGGGTIPDLAETLVLIDGRVPVLVEIKDQSGAFGPGEGALERRVCEIAADHADTCAIMSFNPYSVMAVRDAAPHLLRGLVSYDFEHPHDAHVEASHRKALANLDYFDGSQADFISYGATGLTAAPVMALRGRGVPVFCWTIRSPEAATAALRHCDQITFEGFHPDQP
jgi:glycerophosphoryl diester phosphodiesterase